VYRYSTTIVSDLPLSVGVTDSFRPERSFPYIWILLTISLVSVFAVQCTGSPIRILNVDLEYDHIFKVWTSSSKTQDLVCHKTDSAKFIYYITKIGSPEEVAEKVNERHPLTLVIIYRILENGLESYS
jgi:hypothetical protein